MSQPSTSDDVAYLGEIWHTPVRPEVASGDGLVTIARGALVVGSDGRILDVGDAKVVLARHPGADIVDYGDRLMVPGFIDVHCHYPQLDVIGAHGFPLLRWLDDLTYPLETKLADAGHAAGVAERFATELLAHGVTTAAIYATSSHASAEAMLRIADRRGFRAIVGKVSMDEGAPAALLVDAERDIEQNESLIERWHGRDGRLFVALTPRFALSCSESLMKALGELAARHPSVYVQTHHAENDAEIAAVAQRFPKAKHYLGVYDDFGLVGPRSLLGHVVHPTPDEVALLAERGAAVAHCPTSNLSLGSGLFPLRTLLGAELRIGLSSDVGGGTSLSPWRSMAAAYEIQMMRGEPVSPAFLFHMATQGGADALSLGDQLGSFAPGKRADFLVLDWRRARLLKARFEHSKSANDRLAALLNLGDDRLTERVLVNGREIYRT